MACRHVEFWSWGFKWKKDPNAAKQLDEKCFNEKNSVLMKKKNFQNNSRQNHKTREQRVTTMN